MKIQSLIVTAVLAATPVLAAPPVSTEPIARWSFDRAEKNEFSSTGRAGRPAEIIGAVKSLTGVAGSAASFDAQPAGQLIIPFDLLPATKGVFTVEFWLRVAGRPDPYGTCLDVGGSKGFVIRTNTAGRLGVSTDGKWNVITTLAPLVEQTWVHVALTSDDTTLYFYVDGKEAGVLTLSNPLRLAPNLQLGAVVERTKQPDGSIVEGTVKQLIGDLDELKIYDRVLSPAEIAAKAGLKTAP